MCVICIGPYRLGFHVPYWLVDMTDEKTITNCQRPVVIARIITHIHHSSSPILLLLLLTIVMTMMMTASRYFPLKIPPNVKELAN